MLNIAGPITWTPQDEERLRVLTERKAEFYKTNRQPLFDHVRLNGPLAGVSLNEEMTDWLIKNADTIRDLLKPFDSGERPPRASDEG